jgi:hypothetical protein
LTLSLNLTLVILYAGRTYGTDQGG